MILSEINRERLKIGPVKAVYDNTMPGLCVRAYPGHKKGCPNFNKKLGCPPRVKRFNDVFELDNVYLLMIKFNFKDYLDMMRSRHPEWTDRALRNPLYWQGHIRKEMRDWIKENPIPRDWRYVHAPEAMGINLTATCKEAGIDLEWPPMNNVYSIVIIAKMKAKEQ